jgi:hypothetical protein
MLGIYTRDKTSSMSREDVTSPAEGMVELPRSLLHRVETTRPSDFNVLKLSRHTKCDLHLMEHLFECCQVFHNHILDACTHVHALSVRP